VTLTPRPWFTRLATAGLVLAAVLAVLAAVGASTPAAVHAATSPPTTTTTTTPPTATTTTSTPTTTAPPTTSARPEPSTREPTTPSPTTTTAPPAATTPPERPAAPPAVAQSGISPTTILLAVAALLIASLVLYLVHRAGGRSGPPAAAPGAARHAATPESLTLLLVELGEAMIDAGYPVHDVQEALHRVAEANGIPDGEVIVLPTALFVSLPGGARLETAGSTAGTSSLRLDQVDAVSDVAAAARSGALRPAAALSQLRGIREQPPPFSPLAQALAYTLLSTGLALILRGGVLDLVLAAVLGTLVGALQLTTATLPPGWRAVVPFTSALGVSVAVFLVGRTGVDVGVLPPLIAPLVTFLPGALLTIGVIELATGQLLSGAGRLAGGAMQLVLLGLGIVAGAQLVGVPAASVADLAVRPLGDLAPWIGVALFGIGVVVNRCARPGTLWWILLVLYVAYGAQVLGGLFFGALLSAGVGALAMAPVGAYVASRPTGPSTQVSFLPAFWLLVPGSLGLVGVTMLLGDDWSGAMSALITTGTTMVGIAFGVLIGSAMPFSRAPAPGAGR
jgi:uncharacterized membrane protein YjjP (DUF1212 family)/uncharacterized membrane protein YjjB (DUF3815 family)